MPPTSADTATAPRIRQYEQVQRRALLNPSLNFTRKRTVPQWHAASISPVALACIVKLLEDPPLAKYTHNSSHPAEATAPCNAAISSGPRASVGRHDMGFAFTCG